jgi:hypothetical protein
MSGRIAAYLLSMSAVSGAAGGEMAAMAVGNILA